MTSGEVLAGPTDVELVEQLGFATEPPDRLCDVAVIGAGPSGLSAAVYATSEGLSTVLVNPGVPGGQAGTSSMIRNYLGFPRGLAGVELTIRALEQAWLFGTELVLADEVVGIVADGDNRLVTTRRSQLRARAVVLATGVDWRRLDVPSLESFLGVGVFYGAAVSEAEAMAGRRVVVVGGGNSAGQAAIHLAKRARAVTIAIRGPSLTATMSDYLIREIDASPTIALRRNTEVVDAVGRGRLERLVLRDNASGTTETFDAEALFVMIGAEPRTEWLDGVVARDPAGYVLTGDDVPADAWPLDRPPAFLETSLPGVFAVGDVQHGSTKRVATSVGSGAMAIRLVHQSLEGLTGPRRG
ncbi:MAG: NAD(P)/FAD-dependent oxidoreductase [Lapillicoccus sp.]